MLRCIFCGYCEDACPTEAIVLEDNYELSFCDRASAIYTKEMLIVPVPDGGQPTPQQVEPGNFIAFDSGHGKPVLDVEFQPCRWTVARPKLFPNQR